MSEKSNNDSPDYRNAAHIRMSAYWQKASDLSDGVEALRDYLTKHPAEHDVQFLIRKKQASFLPAFDDTVTGCVGLAFREEPSLEDDVPELIRGTETTEGLAENIDNAGTHWTVFIKQAFDTAVRYGHSVILVENMPVIPGVDLQTERESGRRPYWTRYAPDQIVNWRTAHLGGKKILSQITFRECTQEEAGAFGEETVTRYRVFRRDAVTGIVAWDIYREVKEGEKTNVLWENGGTTGLNEIPVAIIYGKEEGYLESSPPFKQLIDLNLSHFEKLSDYNQNVRCNQWNLLVRVGAGDTSADAPVGPLGLIDIPTGGSALYISPDKSGAEIGRTDLEDVERRMASTGLSVLVEDNGAAKTAKEVTTEHAKSTSKLSSMVKSLKDATERALYFTALYLGEKSGGSVEVGECVDDYTIDAQMLQVLLQAREAGELTRLTFQRVLKGVKGMPEDYDPQKETIELQKEAETQLTDIQNGVANNGQQNDSSGVSQYSN